MVRRRADEPHTGRAVADAGDVLVHLATGQLAPFARLGALADLNLQLVGVGQIVDCHAETSRSDLLNGRTSRVTIFVRRPPLGVLAPFAGVALSAEAVHGNGERLVRLGADRAERHGPRAEAFHDFRGGLHLRNVDRPTVGFLLELQQTT